MPNTTNPNLHQSEILEARKLNEKFYLITCRALSKKFVHLSGQFINLKVGKHIFRSYSITSHPRSLPVWKMFVDITPGGPGTTFIKKLKVGDTIWSSLPMGHFVSKKSKGISIFCATGCGIAPLLPMIEELSTDKQSKNYLIWGLRNEKDAVDLNMLIPKEKSGQLNYSLVLSKPGKLWKGKKGYVDKYLIKICKREASRKPMIYMAGNNEFITGALKQLKDINYPPRNINFEECCFLPTQ